MATATEKEGTGFVLSNCCYIASVVDSESMCYIFIKNRFKRARDPMDAQFWCHDCRAEVECLETDEELTCVQCQGEFVERLPDIDTHERQQQQLEKDEEDEEEEKEHTDDDVIDDPRNFFMMNHSSAHVNSTNPEASSSSSSSTSAPSLQTVVQQMMFNLNNSSNNSNNAANFGFANLNANGNAMNISGLMNNMLQQVLGSSVAVGSPVNSFSDLWQNIALPKLDAGAALGGERLQQFMNSLFVQAQGDCVKKSASKSAVDALRRHVVCDDDDRGNEDGNDEARREEREERSHCAVCQDATVCGDELVEMPCRHWFHVDCLMPWLAERNTCPTCRHELPVD
jgi:Ring finger domain/zinc-ribbon